MFLSLWQCLLMGKLKYKFFRTFANFELPFSNRAVCSQMSTHVRNIGDCDQFSELNETWVFGYGSLVWKADFPYEEKRTGYIKGFLRRFYQNSIDHRGTHEKPGRVVTLIHSNDAEAKVWGMGYRIGKSNVTAVLSHLDYREKNGYDRHRLLFYLYPPSDTQTNEPKNILLYLAKQENPSYAGQHDSLEKIAEQISEAAGESGQNTEYVYKLADAMRQLYPGEEDDHLFSLEQILKSTEARKNIRNATSSCDVDRANVCKEG
ncbi:putative glutathione-specific gamma-glutamylcyclotransferase 2 [Malaya genurostris]|uniref:putative glutathione-specific gamma-glutamylcyclotransferase 2 n=1 Tax=Malaya genurostris TaxID=325434 RepID=UPI0026F3AC45|nr:putative glutathione-specific gamma-glutamylcyclotransferase 2 [Malaya genurostris]